MDIFEKLTIIIIQEQETIIGPIALEQASKVPGLKVDWPKQEITFQGEKKDILEKLIEQYKVLFGQASVEVCREAASKIISQIPKEQIPPILL